MSVEIRRHPSRYERDSESFYSYPQPYTRYYLMGVDGVASPLAEIVNLGRRLVAQLDCKDDLLASWMSHYIAELIDNVEKAPADMRTAAQQACAAADP